MKTIQIQGKTGDSTIRVGETLASLGKYAPLERCIILTDTHVMDIYNNAFPSCKVIVIGTGEKVKTLDTVKDIYRDLTKMEADRFSFIIGIGGGVVCDIAGFVASTYMRGLRFGFVPTTLLAQVDASAGGKNGVNLDGYKNMVGVFNQPEWVICDLSFLKTLPENELLSGFAEIVKHALIESAPLFSYIEENDERMFSLDPGVIKRLVYDSIVIKSAVVNRDEKEKGERRKLNFGHTFGHAFEKTTGVSHGEAVSVGMVAAARLSRHMGHLSMEDIQRIEALLQRLRLPTRLPLDPGQIMDALKKDKKRNGPYIHFVLLRSIGHAFIKKIPIDALRKVVEGSSGS